MPPIILPLTVIVSEQHDDDSWVISGQNITSAFRAFQADAILNCEKYTNVDKDYTQLLYVKSFNIEALTCSSFYHYYMSALFLQMNTTFENSPLSSGH